MIPEPDVRIRRGRGDDAAALARFAARTFEETFAHATAPADMSEHLARAYGEQQQLWELVDPATITLIAEDGGTIAAFAQLRRIEPPRCIEGADAIELRRFYVDRAFHGRGLADRLMAAAVDSVRELGGQRVWLSVFQHNHRAIGFYTRQGFTTVGEQVFLVGSDPQRDEIMIKDLAAASRGD